MLNFEGLIPLGGGIWGLLVVSRVMSVSKDPDKNAAWLRKFGGLLKILSPLLVLFGLVTVFFAR